MAKRVARIGRECVAFCAEFDGPCIVAASGASEDGGDTGFGKAWHERDLLNG